MGAEPGPGLAGAASEHCQGEWQSRARDGRGQLSSGGYSRAFPPAVIPGPGDSRWRDILDRWPELQPALSAEEAQSHLRRGIDALAHRVERLRATGNGVDPITAAWAFLCLERRLRELDDGPVRLPRAVVRAALAASQMSLVL